MVEVRAFDTGSGAPGNGAEFLGAGLATAMRQRSKRSRRASVTTRVMFRRLLGYGRCEPMGFGIFDVERLHFVFSVKHPRFYHSTITGTTPRQAFSSTGGGWQPERPPG